MSNRVGCRCQSCTIRGLTGPAVVITIGVLFLLHQVVHGGHFYFGNTWPVILVVMGILLLASSMASREGHIEPPPGVTSAPPPPGIPPANPPEAPYAPQGQ
jgi:hypothetical protein